MVGMQSDRLADRRESQTQNPLPPHDEADVGDVEVIDHPLR